MSTAKELRHLIGKRVRSIRLRPFDASNGGGRAFAPIIEFEDGSRLTFNVQEVEAAGDYGVELVLARKQQDKA